jgi:hypothetical protein
MMRNKIDDAETIMNKGFQEKYFLVRRLVIFIDNEKGELFFFLYLIKSMCLSTIKNKMLIKKWQKNFLLAKIIFNIVEGN